jgi:signal transduction histidine kinase
LTNVRKHALASRVDLTLDYNDPAAVYLLVRDNGIGDSQDERPPGFGLLGLRERARQLGGRVAVASTPGAGYSLRVELPTIPDDPGGEAEEEGV